MKLLHMSVSDSRHFQLLVRKEDQMFLLLKRVLVPFGAGLFTLESIWKQDKFFHQASQDSDPM